MSNLIVAVLTPRVNQAPVTGKSMSVKMREAPDAKAALGNFDRVGAETRIFAGTIDGAGVIKVMIARLSAIFGPNIGTTIIFYEGSILLVMVNALRLLAFPDGAAPAVNVGRFGLTTRGNLY